MKYKKNTPNTKLYYDFTRDPFCSKALDLSVRNTPYNLINLFGNAGNLQTDSNSDGVADEFIPSTRVISTFTPGTQKIEAATTLGEHYLETLLSGHSADNIAIGDKLYYCGYFQSTIGYARAMLYNRKVDGAYETQLASTTLNSIAGNGFEFVSVLLPITSLYATPEVRIRATIITTGGSASFTGAGEAIEFRQLYYINLTKVFGAGNEPTKVQMDKFIKAQTQYFISTNYFRIKDTIKYGSSWVPEGIEFDGIDDYCDTQNNLDIDITTLSKNNPLIIAFAIIVTKNQAGYIFCKNSSSDLLQQYGIAYTTNNNLSVYLNGDIRLSSANGSIQLNKPYFVVVSFDSEVVKVWINGKLNNSNTYSATTLTSYPNFRIGCRSNAADGSSNAVFFGGIVSELLISNQVQPLDLIDWFKCSNKPRKYGIAMG